MSDLITVTQGEDCCTVVMNDGKANVMSVKMLNALNSAMDEVEAMGGILVIQGRPGMFSGGFDLNVFKTGSREDKLDMLMAGAEISNRLLSFPYPTIAACTGHAIAMGTFLLLSCDYRVGVDGNFKFAANEVAIGLTVPRFATLVAQQRLNPAALNRGLTLAHFFDTQSALQAGFLDELVSADKLTLRMGEVAEQFGKLDMESHRATKLRLRAELLVALRRAIDEDFAGWKEQY